MPDPQQALIRTALSWPCTAHGHIHAAPFSVPALGEILYQNESSCPSHNVQFSFDTALLWSCCSLATSTSPHKKTCSQKERKEKTSCCYRNERKLVTRVRLLNANIPFLLFSSWSSGMSVWKPNTQTWSCEPLCTCCFTLPSLLCLSRQISTPTFFWQASFHFVVQNDL